MIHTRNNRIVSPDDSVNMQDSIYQQVTSTFKLNGKKRTEFGQLLQIMEHLKTSDNNQISSISRYANMSHGTATRNCEKLVKCGLLEYDGKKYRLTSEGIAFLTNCKNFEMFLSRYDLAYVLYY